MIKEIVICIRINVSVYIYVLEVCNLNLAHYKPIVGLEQRPTGIFSTIVEMFLMLWKYKCMNVFNE